MNRESGKVRFLGSPFHLGKLCSNCLYGECVAYDEKNVAFASRIVSLSYINPNFPSNLKDYRKFNRVVVGVSE